MTEMPRRSIWRETILLYQLFQRALIPEQLNLRSLLQNWSNTFEKLSERPRRRTMHYAKLKEIHFSTLIASA